MQYDEHKLVEYFADAPAGVGFSDLDLNNIPHHISCIMDGNGRWATSRGLARTEGHTGQATVFFFLVNVTRSALGVMD